MDDIKSDINLLLDFLRDDASISAEQRGAVKDVKALFATNAQADIAAAFVHATYALRNRLEAADPQYFGSQSFLDGVGGVVRAHCQKCQIQQGKIVSGYLVLILGAIQTKARQARENSGFNYVMKVMGRILSTIKASCFEKVD